MNVNIDIKKHDPYFDNIKLLLIFLVVFGHIIENKIAVDPIYRNIYIMIYSFHMPLFVFISGYFSKNLEKSDKNAFKTGLLYLLIHIVIDLFATDPAPLLTPYWLDWYLLSLFIWRLAIKWLHKIKFIIPISIATALIAGFIPQVGRSMSLSRTITFLPFFLMGFFFDKEKIKYIKEKLRGSV
jgi:fucose 4-O-acetylase-like acetyltransferase